MLDEPICLEPYREDWPEIFEAERKRLVQALGIHPTAVEHTGSTAVVGLTAKPILDIMVGSSTVPCPEAWSVTLAHLGYESMGEAGVPGRWYFRHRVPPFRNAHVVELNGSHWQSLFPRVPSTSRVRTRRRTGARLLGSRCPRLFRPCFAGPPEKSIRRTTRSCEVGRTPSVWTSRGSVPCCSTRSPMPRSDEA
jgi:hypothetical protein